MSEYEETMSLCKQRVLCKNESCIVCYNKSFASHEKSKYWSNDNSVTPREITKYCNKKFEFNCEVCNHTFLKSIYKITNNIKSQWCPYCSGKRLCDNDNCEECFNKSFASHEKSEWWSKNNDIDNAPRQIFKSSNKKYKFNCEKCNHEFLNSLNSITNKKSNWCSFCSNRKLCQKDNCEICFNKSFASHPKVKYWSKNNDNDVIPRQIFKSSNKKYKFDCIKCNHEFLGMMSDITRKEKGTWCPYCTNIKLCSNKECKTCFNKSFASHEKSEWWSKNNDIDNAPRQIFKSSNKKYKFNCEKCKHEFLKSIHTITNNVKPQWCPYCSGKRLCDNDNCKECFNKSFASHPRSKFISNRNPANPRLLFKNAGIKIEFKCDKCNNYFSTRVCNTSKLSPTWCPFCKNKTEQKLFEFIIERYPDVVRQYKPNWCKSYITKKCLPFDFFILSLKIILELDGEQHFRQVATWKGPKYVQSKDLYKMKLAYDNGISVIRIPYEYIYNDQDFLLYQKKITDILLEHKNLESPKIIYLCDDDRYDHFKDFDFSGDIIPEIISEKDR